MNIKQIRLKPTKEKSILRFHPWVFSGAIKEVDSDVMEGDIVEVISNKGRYLATGHYQIGTISVRIFEFKQQPIDDQYWSTKIAKAISLRKDLGFIDNKTTNIFRLVHAEGDEMPGCIIDVYNTAAIVQFHSFGMWQLRNTFSEIIQKLLPKIEYIYDKSSKTLPEKFIVDNTITNSYLYKSGKEDQVVATEHNNLFKIDWINGQKTGFFIDQRENRQLLGQLSKGKKVLNTFCYSGGFSIFALNGGAKEVHSLDSSKKAIELVEKNLELIDSDVGKHELIVDDAMDFIKNLKEDYDIIVLDPPAFAKHQKVRHKAIQGYKRLNGRAIEQIKPGGILFTFSCSQVIDKELFRHTILSAAINAGRSVKILHQLHQPADHPVNIYHPESEYLKGLVLKIY
jgi:23S rRNA (cytosine1962-C5)-methyltransferase